MTMKSLITAALALSLTSTAAPAEATKLPQSYHGDWCFVMRVQNGHDSNGKRIPNNLYYRRGDITDCEDFISIDAKSYSTHDSECRILRARKFQNGYHVTYNCGDGTSRMTIYRDKNDLFIEQ